MKLLTLFSVATFGALSSSIYYSIYKNNKEFQDYITLKEFYKYKSKFI